MLVAQTNHLSKDLAQPQRRLNALAAIEGTIMQNEPSLLAAGNLFEKYDKHSFQLQYAEWKNKPLSGAEKSVIVGLCIFAFSDGTPADRGHPSPFIE